jgi:catalase (peroxidase I)
MDEGDRRDRSAPTGGFGGADAITSGREVVWTQTQSSNFFFQNPFKYEWEPRPL